MQLGVPDIGLTTLTEIADTVAAISDVVALPLLVDADTGFGNALNMRRTVRLLERAGAAEDPRSRIRCFLRSAATFPARRVILTCGEWGAED